LVTLASRLTSAKGRNVGGIAAVASGDAAAGAGAAGGGACAIEVADSDANMAIVRILSAKEWGCRARACVMEILLN
jgi:hypothetical protein